MLLILCNRGRCIDAIPITDKLANRLLNFNFLDDFYSQSIQCKNESSLLRSVFHSSLPNVVMSSCGDVAMTENNIMPLHIVNDPWNETERRKMARSHLKDYCNVKVLNHDMPVLRKGGSITICKYGESVSL